MSDPAAASWEQGLRIAAPRGDAAAWRALYDSAFETVAGYARWRTGCDDLAEEVVQEAWLAAARRLASFDPHRARFAAWVCGIAANVARNLVRRSLRHRVQSLVTVPQPAVEEDAGDPLRVARALAEIPERYEAALRAKYFDGASVAEMAAANGDSEKAVESLLSRARAAFREAYGEPTS